jgi:hypothetical protein
MNSSDPGDRANGPGAWPTLLRSADTVNATVTEPTAADQDQTDPPDPTRPPRLVPGCDVCAALERQRAAAERDGDVRRATTCEVEIRSHPKHKGTA